MPGAYSREQKARFTQKVDTSSRFVTDVLDGSNTSQTISLGASVSKVSVQSDGDLAGNVLFSLNGEDFFDSTAFAANTPVSYSTHNVLYVRVDRTSGSGSLILAAK